MAREKRNATKVSYIISNPILDNLSQYCEQTGRTKTWVIESALKGYLEEHQDEFDAVSTDNGKTK